MVVEIVAIAYRPVSVCSVSVRVWREHAGLQREHAAFRTSIVTSLRAASAPAAD